MNVEIGNRRYENGYAFPIITRVLVTPVIRTFSLARNWLWSILEASVNLALLCGQQVPVAVISMLQGRSAAM